MSFFLNNKDSISVGGFINLWFSAVIATETQDFVVYFVLYFVCQTVLLSFA